MIIYPAIDLQNGRCVRLYKGDMSQATIFNNNPLAQAEYFAKQGFKFLHIVDLDAAVSGSKVNHESIKKILAHINIPIQLGGGIRDLNAIERWLNIGVKRVIIGTAALNNPGLVKEASKKFPGRILVGIDAKNGLVVTHGWLEDSKTSAVFLAQQFEDSGVAAIIYTDINRDGAMTGPNLEENRALAQAVKIPIIASGGVSCLEDIVKLKTIKDPEIDGVIVGRALYDKKIAVNDLLNL